MDVGSGKERRRAFRVDDDVHLEFRELISGENEEESPPEKELQTCRALLQLRELTIQSGHLLAGIRKNHSEIAQYLTLLDKKIDAVAQIAGAISFGGDVQPNHRVNISANGMAFVHHNALAPTTRLHLRIILFPSMLCIQPLARVVYCKERPKAEARRRYRIGVEFEALAEQEQDMLIRHMMERQSAQRRKERGLDDD